MPPPRLCIYAVTYYQVIRFQVRNSLYTYNVLYTASSFLFFASTFDSFTIMHRWPPTLETSTALPTHMMNIYAKFHWNPSTTYRDVASCEISIKGQRPAGRTTRKYDTFCLVLLAEVWN